MTLQEKKTAMYSMVEQWQQSGLHQTVFSVQEGISIQKLRYWISKYRHEMSPESAFVQINGQMHEGISIRYPNGVELSLPAQVSVSVIRSLIQI
jgi:hypothetical protein